MTNINQIPDDLLRQIEVIAAKSGESLDDFITEALRARLEQQVGKTSVTGWRKVFGKARREEVETIDRLVGEEFEQIKSDKQGVLG